MTRPMQPLKRGGPPAPSPGRSTPLLRRHATGRPLSADSIQSARSRSSCDDALSACTAFHTDSSACRWCCSERTRTARFLRHLAHTLDEQALELPLLPPIRAKKPKKGVLQEQEQATETPPRRHAGRRSEQCCSAIQVRVRCFLRRAAPVHPFSRTPGRRPRHARGAPAESRRGGAAGRQQPGDIVLRQNVLSRLCRLARSVFRCVVDAAHELGRVVKIWFSPGATLG